MKNEIDILGTIYKIEYKEVDEMKDLKEMKLLQTLTIRQ